MELQDLNHWWNEGAVKEAFSPSLHRALFYTISKDIERKQIQVIVGLRRVGKSTIVFQIIDKLIKSGVKPKNILYCSFDEPELQEKRIEGILREYAKITNVDYKKEDLYLFLDEVQKASEWIASTKLLYDNFKNIRKIIITGSASLNILSDSKRDLAGRALYYELKPLDFGEFLRFKGVKIEKNEVLLHKDTLEREFEKFKFRQFPELVDEESTDFIKGYIRSSVIEPIILKDIPREFKEIDILLMEKLVNIFLSDPGEYINIDGLAKELSRAKTTIYKALFYLEFSFLIRRVLNFRPSIRIASRKLSRIYPYHPVLSLPFGIKEEKYAENLVLFDLDARYYWRDKEKEIDFLADSIPVEVKFSSKVRRDDLRWLVYFERKYKRSLGLKKAFVITKDVEGKVDNINLIPLWRFCFVGLKI